MRGYLSIYRHATTRCGEVESAVKKQLGDFANHFGLRIVQIPKRISIPMACCWLRHRVGRAASPRCVREFLSYGLPLVPVDLEILNAGLLRE